MTQMDPQFLIKQQQQMQHAAMQQQQKEQQRVNTICIKYIFSADTLRYHTVCYSWTFMYCEH